MLNKAILMGRSRCRPGTETNGERRISNKLPDSGKPYI